MRQQPLHFLALLAPRGLLPLLLFVLCSGCATASLWDRTASSNFLPVRHIGQPPNTNTIVVGFGHSDADERWYQLSPGRLGFWQNCGAELKTNGHSVVFSSEQVSALEAANASRLSHTPTGAAWFSAEPVALVSPKRSSLIAPNVVAYRVIAKHDSLSDAHIDSSAAIAEPGTQVLVLPRAPKGAQDAELATAILLTPFTAVFDLITLPVSLPMAAHRPGTGP